ncbi:MAG: DEAD/DEAH box helicase, partial [Treponemataceae bacterium]|nr:DEAD/DEAH box helicase [Treponemataceae bacterium]
MNDGAACEVSESAAVSVGDDGRIVESAAVDESVAEADSAAVDESVAEAGSAAVDADDDEISFEDLGLDETTLKAVKTKGFETPSPIQILAIPRLLNGDANIIAKARTGTGKTAAFGLPLVQRIRSDAGFPQALILTPTRELAMQVCREIESFTTGKYPRLTTVYGGASITSQLRDLKRGVEIVVGTPGRVMDLLDRGALKLDKISYFILDEADEMLDMGFVEDIEKIFGEANPDSRILLFSATMPPEILKIASKFMGEYEVVEEEAKPEEPLLTEQHYWVVREGEKIEALVRLIDISPDFYGLVFTQTKVDADAVSKQLDERGYEVAALHGDIPQTQREKILARFRTGKTRILVATDVAARGIDIEGLSHVVNYALPYDGATYIHRIGRTGRAGAKGLAYSFVRPEERRKVEYLKQVAKKATKGVLQEDPVPSVDEVLSVKRARLFGELKAKLSGEVKVSKVFREFVADLCAPVLSEGVPSEICEAATAPAATDGEPTTAAVEVTAPAETTKPAASEVSAPVAVAPEEMLARLVQHYFGTKLDASRYGNISVSRSGKASDQMRLYIQIGRRDGFNARELSVFLSDLLRIPERLVDRIEITENFSLVSLPVAHGKRLLEISTRDRSLPHVHVDTKDGGGKKEGRGKRDGGSRGGNRGGFSGKGGFGGRSGERGAGARFGGDRERGDRGFGRGFGSEFGGRGFGGKGGRSKFGDGADRGFG